MQTFRQHSVDTFDGDVPRYAPLVVVRMRFLRSSKEAGTVTSRGTANADVSAMFGMKDCRLAGCVGLARGLDERSVDGVDGEVPDVDVIVPRRLLYSAIEIFFTCFAGGGSSATLTTGALGKP